ncbi:hypothetical protein BKA70DRAFT_209650 [Coprinopsis sp. MPI-PUGE-AT-0042]|nr:hypothetical protein BKA70DRAFT_209650 [Coprinopsis sp. MPI-PUGE-AT-0042]
MLFSMRSFLLTAAFCFACVGVACARPTDRPSDVPALSRRGVEVKERLPLKNEIIKVLESRSGFFNGDAELAKVESGQKPAPHAARITFSDLARQELDRMGLHGKDRRKTVKWHKKHVKKEMKKIGASSAMVDAYRSQRRKQPQRSHHITASFKNRDGRAIKNNFTMAQTTTYTSTVRE